MSLACRHLMARQGQNAFVDGVNHPFLLREEGFFHFGRRRDPIARAHHDHRRIQIIKGQLADVRGHRVQKRTTLAGIGGQQGPCLFF